MSSHPKNVARKTPETGPATPAVRPPTRRKHLWPFRITALLLALIIAEAGLRILMALSPDVRWAMSPPSPWLNVSTVVADAELGYRGDPRVPEHDPLGFRNPSIPDVFDVVVIGDSQTYGVGVEWFESFPAQLSRASGRNIYNMGVAGWGPVHYRRILEDALKTKPQLVIVGLYLGNDVFDSYRDVYDEPLAIGADLADEKIWQEKLAVLRESQPAIKQIAALYQQTVEDNRLADGRRSAPLEAEPLLLHYCMIARLTDSLWRIVWRIDARTAAEKWNATKSWASQRPEHLVVIDTENVQTVLTVPYRGFAVNIDDPRIVEGLRVTEMILGQMSERCREQNVDFLVLLIPTKETVLQSLADPKSDAYERLLSGEKALASKIDEQLRDMQIPVVDATLFLVEPLSQGENSYSPSTDGHPSPVGHRSIAAGLAEHPLIRHVVR